MKPWQNPGRQKQSSDPTFTMSFWVGLAFFFFFYTHSALHGTKSMLSIWTQHCYIEVSSHTTLFLLYPIHHRYLIIFHPYNQSFVSSPLAMLTAYMLQKSTRRKFSIDFSAYNFSSIIGLPISAAFGSRNWK